MDYPHPKKYKYEEDPKTFKDTDQYSDEVVFANEELFMIPK